MRLRVLVGAAGTPRPVTRAPFDVLENGIAGARWAVADRSLDEPLNEARSALLRALQTRVGAPARPLRQVLVRLPRRLSGPRLHRHLPAGWWASSLRHVEERGADGWSEAIRWLRGLQPAGEPASPRFQWLFGLPWLWEQSYRGAGLGSPAPQRYPRRTRSRRGRGPKQRAREVELGLRLADIADVELEASGSAMSTMWGRIQEFRDHLVASSVLPLGHLLGPDPAAVAREVGKAVAAAGATATDVRVGGSTIHVTATVPLPMEENPELPVRLDAPASAPAPLTLRDLRRARAELEATAAQTNPDGTYDAFLGPQEAYEVQSDPEFQRMAMGVMWPEGDGGPIASVSGMRLFRRKRPGWSVEPAARRPGAPICDDFRPPPARQRLLVPGDEPVPQVVHRRELQVYGVRYPGGHTVIAARSYERARSLAARGYRNVYERHDGAVATISFALQAHRTIVYDDLNPARTVVLDLTRGVPSIELPELELSAIAPIEGHRQYDGSTAYHVNLATYGEDDIARRRIHAALRQWYPETPTLNLRIETDQQRRQVACTMRLSDGGDVLFRVQPA